MNLTHRLVGKFRIIITDATRLPEEGFAGHEQVEMRIIRLTLLPLFPVLIPEPLLNGLRVAGGHRFQTPLHGAELRARAR